MLVISFLFSLFSSSLFFFFNDTATTEIYTLSLHDALPISPTTRPTPTCCCAMPTRPCRSEEHTSELQSHSDLVCRLLLEKKKKYSSGHIRSHLEHIPGISCSGTESQSRCQSSIYSLHFAYS